MIINKSLCRTCAKLCALLFGFLFQIELAVVSAQDLHPPTFLTNGLVAYYPLTQNFNGAFGSPPLVSTNPPRFAPDDGGAVFTGPANYYYLETPEAPSFFDSRSQFTISFGIQFEDDKNDWVPVFAAGPLLIHVSNATLSLAQWNRDTQDFWIEKTVTTSFRTMRFLSIVFRKNNLNAKDGKVFFFIDGVLQSSAYMQMGDYGVASTSDIESLVIGSPWREWKKPFDGRLKALSIYNRALSEAEVNALYEYVSSTPGPREAKAMAQVVNGFLVGATIVDGGSGYTNNPVVTVVGGGGNGAKVTATVRDGSVVGLTVLASGIGYANLPAVAISAPPRPPAKATAVASFLNGFVVQVLLTRVGFGYDSPPEVLLVGGGGTGAKAVATVEGGVVTGIQITNPGIGYTGAPIVRIASPPFTARLAVEVSKVRVKMDLVLGRRYQLEASPNLNVWNPAGDPFVAQEEQLVEEFDVDTVGRYFRIVQVP